MDLINHMANLQNKCMAYCSKVDTSSMVRSPVNLRVGAVDAGMITQSFMGFDHVLIRAVGGVYKYEQDKLVDVSYVPSPCPLPLQNVVCDEDYSGKAYSLIRLKNEIDIALKLVDKCDIVLLDGSIAPLPCDKPSSDSELFKDYQDLISSYKALYSECVDKKVMLAGVLKDTNGKVIIKEIAEEINVPDIFFLNYCLQEGQITSPVSYRVPTLDDINLSYGIKLSYIKPSDFDSPIRVEYLTDVGPTLETVYSLSSMNKRYAYPPPLVDIDMKARLKNEKVNLPILPDMLKRRNNRPF